MGMFKVKLQFGNIALLVENKEQWDRLVALYGHLTVDECLERIYVEHATKLHEVV